MLHRSSHQVLHSKCTDHESLQLLLRVIYRGKEEETHLRTGFLDELNRTRSRNMFTRACTIQCFPAYGFRIDIKSKSLLI
jgi:hypothetical protein